MERLLNGYGALQGMIASDRIKMAKSHMIERYGHMDTSQVHLMLIKYAKDRGMTVQDAADHILKAIYIEGRQKYES